MLVKNKKKTPLVPLLPRLNLTPSFLTLLPPPHPSSAGDEEWGLCSVHNCDGFGWDRANFLHRS